MKTLELPRDDDQRRLTSSPTAWTENLRMDDMEYLRGTLTIMRATKALRGKRYLPKDRGHKIMESLKRLERRGRVIIEAARTVRLLRKK